ncbi:MAG: hypothetical protein CVV51_07555 [Spirochaetae bacterium HGW-Spirochaetae-7]|nr:MAG: hypothetical protein CVV51_07555 [Spirochaetae bacterium HGW-Spirochaetae-7]
MKNEKTRLLVIFEDEKENLEAIAKNIKTQVGSKALVKTRPASEVAIAEILAADVYAFGVENPSSHAWAEVKRLLAGMNLAGRKAGFFASRAGVVDKLKAALLPAELIVAEEDLVAEQAEGTGPWIQALIAAR